MTVPNFTGTLPNRNQLEDDFDDNVADFIVELPPVITGMNNAVGLVNDAAAAAEISRVAAYNASVVAAAFANYKGDWNASTTYALGDGVTHLGFIAAAKRANTGVEPTISATDDWIITQRPVYEESFLVSGAWPKPSGCSWIAVEVIGAGASGGAQDGGGVASGGGGGSSVSKLYRADELPSTVDIIVGTGGAPVFATSGGAPVAGNAGGNSSFGDLVAFGGGRSPLPTPLPSQGGSFVASGASSYNSAGGGSTSTNSPGGSCIYGGAGGGAHLNAAGGSSALGGDGGAGFNDNIDGHAEDGAVPGGGGGARGNSNSNTRRSGKGGDGMVSIGAW